MLRQNIERYNQNHDDNKMIELLGKVDLDAQEKEEDIEKEEVDKMDEEEDKNKQTRQLKDKIINILEELNYAKQRSSKLTLEDFLRLLYNFTTNGIHFR